jgi:hypothetical protein
MISVKMDKKDEAIVFRKNLKCLLQDAASEMRNIAKFYKKNLKRS